jgi:hypothetical protein
MSDAPLNVGAYERGSDKDLEQVSQSWWRAAFPTAAVRGSKLDLIMWDLWWDKVALGQVFSEYFGFPCNRRSLHQLLHNHPHVPSGEYTIGQCGRSAGTYRDLGDLKQRDLRNLNLGDMKKGPKGA